MQVVDPKDKRIHFALNCGAKSCPPIRVFAPENVDTSLQKAAEAFCEGESGALGESYCLTEKSPVLAGQSHPCRKM